MMVTRNIYAIIKTYLAGIVLALLAFSVPSLCLGQGLRKLKPEQYDLWSTLELLAISKDGNYVSYSLSYPSGQDTLFVVHTKLNRKWVFPKADKGTFYGEALFVCKAGPSKLLLQDLTKDHPVALEADRYDLIEGSANLIIFKNADGGSHLTIVDRIGNKLLTVKDISEYKISPDRKHLLYTRENKVGSEVGIINVPGIKNRIIANSEEGSYQSPSWQKNSGSVCYILNYHRTGAAPSICYHQLGSSKPPSVLVTDTLVDSISIVSKSLAISDDGKAVFFSVADSLLPQQVNDKVQVWNSSDTYIYPKRALAEKYRNPTMYAWFPGQGKFMKVASDNANITILSGNSRFAIAIYAQGNPNFSRYSKGKFLAVDLHKENLLPVLENFSLNPNLISINPGGEKLLYLKDSNWWLYDMYAGTKRNLTKDIIAEWDNTTEPAPQEFSAFGIAGWSSNGKSIFLYDRYDLWRIDLINGKGMRLTNGRETGKTYRINRDQTGLKYLRSYSGHATPVLDLDQPLLLESKTSNNCQEILILKPGSGIIILRNSGMILDQALISENGYIAYREQSFVVSPNIKFFDPVDSVSHTIVETNTQQEQYEWGHAELISYISSSGKSLKGALYYPAGYVNSRKYPMVVEIYEQRSKYLNHYCNPSLNNPTGFNITNYTLDGYFVLLPDIDYIEGDPGKSARDCVLASVAAAAKDNAINTERVGLIGHSFGGYETGIILTGTDFFAAAVAGAGVSDPVGYIFTHGDDTLEPQFWRFESQQYRMGRSFFQDKDSYLRNSTIHNAEGINTPLLIWCGLADPTVTSLESIKLYNALRRLGRKNTMLIYPGESHYLSNQDNKRDLTLRLQQWFGHFLKEMPAAEWIR